jgi:hypothetical protein
VAFSIGYSCEFGKASEETLFCNSHLSVLFAIAVVWGKGYMLSRDAGCSLLWMSFRCCIAPELRTIIYGA